MTTVYYLRMDPVTRDYTLCMECGRITDTTLWMANTPQMPEVLALELCDECRDQVLVGREES